MSTKEKLTIQELEQLSQAYMDCRLSILQERDLELVLLSSDVSSPLIDEARGLMGLENSMAILSVNGIKHKKCVRMRFFKYVGIAAAIAIATIFSLVYLRPTTTTKNSPEIYVYVDGEVLSGEMAQTIVRETEDLSMEMFNSAIDEAESEQLYSTEYMNSIIH